MAAKKSSPRKKTAAGEPASKKNNSNDMALTKAKRQTTAIITLFSAVLLMCIVVIPGEVAWLGMHKFFRGMFGFCAFIMPVLMVYIAVIAAMDRPISIRAKLWQCVLLLVMIDSIIHLFAFPDIEQNYFSAIGDSFVMGIDIKSGGVMGAVLGYPLAFFFTNIGAKIILFLLAALFVMLITGTTIFAVINAASTPVKKTRESIENAMINGVQRHAERQEQRRLKRESASSIDIEVGYGYPTISPGVDDAVNPDLLEDFTRKANALNEEDSSVLIPSGSPIDIALGDVGAIPEPIIHSEDSPMDESSADRRRKREDMGAAIDMPEMENLTDATMADSEYTYPPLSLLDNSKGMDVVVSEQEQQSVSEQLIKTLKDFGIDTALVGISRGPTVTRYELEPSAGVKISKITGLVDDLALRLATVGVRIEAPIPNKAAVGIEVPNKVGNMVCLKELLDSKEFASSKSRLTVVLGKDIAGNKIVADLAKMPHLLIAGTTGSGKSVCTNAMIQSVLYKASPQEVRMILIDPKKVEFRIYNGIPHLLVPVVTDPRKAAGALGWAVTEMLRRYEVFAEYNVRDLESYNELAAKTEDMKKLPLILIVIDELSDLMMAAANEVEDAIIRLAQMARAAGMHLVIATQRPSVDVITGLIKANIPSRLALTVSSAVDSRTILDTGGAERLLGRGDMLFMPVGLSKPLRVQGCFVSNHEVENVVDFLKKSDESETDYDVAVMDEIEKQAAAADKSTKKASAADDGDEDEMLPQAIEYVVEAAEASTSMLQRKLRLGYARAGRLIDMMEQRGIVGPHEGSKPRKVLMTRQQWLEMNMSRPEAAMITDNEVANDQMDDQDEPW